MIPLAKVMDTNCIIVSKAAEMLIVSEQYVRILIRLEKIPAE